MRGWGFKAILAFALGAAAVSARAADKPDWAGSSQKPSRRALVIGVSSYDHARQLVTPVNDATAAAVALSDLHFTTVTIVPGEGRIDRDGLIAAVRAFVATLQPGDLAVVFYSGHGVQVDGVNYLVGSDGSAQPAFPGLEWLSVDYLLGQIAARDVAAAVVVLDACRADPFTGTAPDDRDVLGAPQPAASAPALTGGLAPPTAPGPFVVAFAAQPKAVAYSRFPSDPKGASSIYTRSLVSRLVRSAPLRKALAGTDADVKSATGELQVPMSSSSGVWDLPMDGARDDDPTTEEEWRYMLTVQPIAEQVAQLKDFLLFHPLSVHAAAARARLAAIRADIAVAGAPLTQPPPDQTALLLGNLLAARGSADGITAVTNAPVTLRGRPGGGTSRGPLSAGAEVKLLQYRSGFARVLAPDGRFGWIGGVRRADPGQVASEVNLSFNGGDEHADATDWAPLTSAARALSGTRAAVTVRTGAGSAEDPAQSRLAGRLRALRIRDYVVRLGVTPEQVVLLQNDASVPADQARVSLVEVTQ